MAMSVAILVSVLIPCLDSNKAVWNPADISSSTASTLYYGKRLDSSAIENGNNNKVQINTCD